jgi:hypothetical protein
MPRAVLLMMLFAVPAAAISIGEARADNDGDGIPDLLGETVTVTGVATCEPTLFSETGVSFYIQDSTAGINIYAYDPPVFAVGPGDTLQITGEIKQYNGLTELSPADPSDWELVGSGPPPSPMQLARHQGVSEELEGMLLRAGDPTGPSWVTVAGDPVEAGGGYNFSVWNGQISIAVRVFGSTGIDVSAVQSGTRLFLTGIGGQYDSEPPYLDGYQLIPRYQSDLAVYNPSVGDYFHLDVSGAPFAPDMGEYVTMEFGGPQGMRFTIKVFDRSGREVARLAESRTAGDVIEWSGRDDRDETLPMGPYLVLLEGVDTDGTRLTTTETVVVAADLE